MELNPKPTTATGTVGHPARCRFPAVKERTVSARFTGGDVTREAGIPSVLLQ